MKKENAGKTEMKVGAGLAAAAAVAAAGYYFYGSKNAKGHRKVAAKELKANWKMVQREVKSTVRKSVSRAKKS